MSNIEQLNTENIVEEVKEVVTEIIPETAPAVEPTETVEEVVNEVAEEKKTKSFFDIFKKDKPVEESAEAGAPAAEVAEAAEGEAVEGAAVEEAATEEVPVDDTSAKKKGLCGLCAFGKKSDATEEAAPVTEEAAPAAEGETAAATEEDAAPVAEEVAPVTDEAAAPVVAAAAVAGDDAAAETTEAVDVAPVVEADVVRSGILFKSGKFFKSNMNERHCRLLSGGAFQWSKTDDFTKAHECMVNGETTTVAFMAEGESAEHKYRFELHCCGSVTTYAVDTEEDRDEWVRAIETVKESVAPVVTEEVAAEVAVEETPAAE